jgi:predicted DCC family thiol-disulfide oxidoreductase YuxK
MFTAKRMRARYGLAVTAARSLVAMAELRAEAVAMTTASAPHSLGLAPATLFFDGVCGFCTREVRWLLKHDTTGRITFAALQGETAARVRAAIPGSIPDELETMVLAEADGEGVRFAYRSDAAMRILDVTGAAPWVHRALRVTPRVVRELGYRFIARYRYRIWGQLDACLVPRPDQQARFLP